MPIINDDFLEKRCKTYPSPWDNRNYRVRSPVLREVQAIPDEFDGLKPFLSDKWYNQGSIGSCVGWDGKVTMEVTNHLLDGVPDELSAWWLYHRSRAYAALPPGVEGSTNIALMKALYHDGACLETCTPTPTDRRFTKFEPCETAYDQAKGFAIDSYWYVNINPNDMKAAIYGVTHEAPYKMPDGSHGKIPLVTAYPVYSSFSEANDDGIVPMPFEGETLRGGHSSQIRGWKIIDGKEYWINTNSWGSEVGDKGTFYLPIDYPFYDAWLIHNGPRKYPWWCPLVSWLPWWKKTCK